MSLAWTTVLIILLMLPGVAVLTGIAAAERYAREIVRSTAIGEIALAIFAALVIHALSILLFSQPLSILKAIVVFETQQTPGPLWPLVENALPKIVLYLIATAAVGFGIGLAISNLIASGPLRFLATHSWIYDVVRYSKGRDGLVTAYVMTKTVENDRVLIYKGRLSEIFLKEDGSIAYLALQNSGRFHMKFDDAGTLGDHLDLFDAPGAAENWNYLMIHGAEIANVLFNRSPVIKRNPEGLKALDEALKKAAPVARDAGPDGGGAQTATD